jgi:hypothetical protein
MLGSHTKGYAHGVHTRPATSQFSAHQVAKLLVDLIRGREY